LLASQTDPGWWSETRYYKWSTDNLTGG